MAVEFPNIDKPAGLSGGSDAWDTQAGAVLASEYFDAATSAYSMLAEPGALAMSGQNAILKKWHRVDATPAAYALTGQAAHTKKSRALYAGAGSCLLSGIGADLRSSRVLTALACSLSLTGRDAHPLFSGGSTATAMIQTPQNFAINMAAINGDYVRFINGYGPTAYALSGQPAALGVHRVAITQPGAFSLAGQAVNFGVSRHMFAAAGGFELAGQSVEFYYVQAYDLQVEPGSHAFTGYEVSFRLGIFAYTELRKFKVARDIRAFTVPDDGSSLPVMDFVRQFKVSNDSRSFVVSGVR